MYKAVNQVRDQMANMSSALNYILKQNYQVDHQSLSPEKKKERNPKIYLM